MHADDREARRLAFVVITLLFLVSVAALLYWAINIATAGISSRVTAHFCNYSPLNSLTNSGVILTSKIAKLNNYIVI